MLKITPAQKLDDVVSRCRKAGDPIPGLFFLAKCTNEAYRASDLCLAAMASLLKIQPRAPDDWFRIHSLDEIVKGAKAIGFVGSTDEMGVVHPVFGQHSDLLVCQGWSVAAWLLRNKCEWLMHEYLGAVRELMPDQKLPGLKDPLAMPITKDSVVGGGVAHSLGQWLPACRARPELAEPPIDRTISLGKRFTQWLVSKPTPQPSSCEYDLLDLSIMRDSVPAFYSVCHHFNAHVNDEPAAKGGYLARQAIHAFDGGIEKITARLKIQRASQLEQGAGPSPTQDTTEAQPFNASLPLNFPAAFIVQQAFLHGARLTPSSWAGPSGKGRTFTDPSGQIMALVDAIVMPPDESVRFPDAVLDEKLAAALARMKEDGHDVVIRHRDQSPSNPGPPRSTLPLHMCASQGMTRSVVALLSAGADPKAVITTDEGTLSLQNSADKHPSTSEEIMHTVRAFEARRKAHGILEEMQLDAPQAMA